jgi:ABC transport system ATP-binding/permease protein
LRSLRKYYVAYSNNAKDRKDALVTKLQKENPDAFLELRDRYANESLEEFVTNKNETIKTVEYNGEIIQKLEPIYMDPKHPFHKVTFLFTD